ncbi:MAG: efflux RND transporter periplasmic adaptor subunit [Cyanobacteria bacterium P01_C01_bin.120]
MSHSSAPGMNSGTGGSVTDDGNQGPAEQQEKRQKPSVWWLLLAAGLVTGGLLWFTLRGRSSSGPSEPQPVSVELQRVQESTVEESSEFVGQLEAQQGTVLQAETEGRITQIFVSSGDRVAVGEPIAQLSPDRSQAEYRGALADVRAAQAGRGNAIAQLEVAQADQISAEAEVALQLKEIERTQMLVSRGALEQRQLDRVQRDIDSAQADLNAAIKRVEAARTQLNQTEADVARSQADANAIQEDLADTLVVAPIDGQVGELSVKLGDYVTTSVVLTSIVQNDTLDLELAIPVERRGDLRLGMPVELLSEDDQQPMNTGSLSFVSPQTRESSQLVQVEATFENSSGQLQDAQRMRSRIIWSTRSGVLVPTDAISRIGGATFVFVAVPGEANEAGEQPLIAEQRSVTLGAIQDNQYQIEDGLEPGERIVVSGLLNVSDGATITTAAGSANRPGDTTAQADEAGDG